MAFEEAKGQVHGFYHVLACGRCEAVIFKVPQDMWGEHAHPRVFDWAIAGVDKACDDHEAQCSGFDLVWFHPWPDGNDSN